MAKIDTDKLVAGRPAYRSPEGRCRSRFHLLRQKTDVGKAGGGYLAPGSSLTFLGAGNLDRFLHPGAQCVNVLQDVSRHFVILHDV